MKRVFISYTHKDAAFRDALVTHLRILHDAGIVESWHDGEIRPGDDWKDHIDRELRRADIILLLVSADFLASRSCQEIELGPALSRWAQNLALILPIIVRSCDWEISAISRFQALPESGRPIVTWSHPDDAWTEITRWIRTVAAPQSASPSTERPQPLPPVVDPQTGSASHVSPALVWQLRGTPTDPLNPAALRKELPRTLQQSTVVYQRQRGTRLAQSLLYEPSLYDGRWVRWPHALLLPHHSSSNRGNLLCARGSTNGDEQLSAELNGAIIYQRTIFRTRSFPDDDLDFVHFGDMAFDALHFLMFLARYAHKLRLQGRFALTALIWVRKTHRGAFAVFKETALAPEQSDPRYRHYRLLSRFASVSTHVQPTFLRSRDSLLAASKQLLDEVAHEFVYEPERQFEFEPIRPLTISMESLCTLWERLSIPDDVLSCEIGSEPER